MLHSIHVVIYLDIQVRSSLVFFARLHFIALSIYKIQKTYPVRVKNMIIRLVKIIICCFAMNGIYVIVRWIGIDPTQYSRLLAIIFVAILEH